MSLIEANHQIRRGDEPEARAGGAQALQPSTDVDGTGARAAPSSSSMDPADRNRSRYTFASAGGPVGRKVLQRDAVAARPSGVQ